MLGLLLGAHVHEPRKHALRILNGLHHVLELIPAPPHPDRETLALQQRHQTGEHRIQSSQHRERDFMAVVRSKACDRGCDEDLQAIQSVDEKVADVVPNARRQRFINRSSIYPVIRYRRFENKLLPSPRRSSRSVKDGMFI